MGARKRTEADLRQMAKHYREQGFSDGSAGLVARSTNIEYQRAWKRGAAERRKAGDAA
jgi:hypothetical protein